MNWSCRSGAVLRESSLIPWTADQRHLFFLLIAPENSAGIHLRALAKISRLLKSSHFRQRLLEAGTEEELFQVIQEEDKEF